MLTPNAKRVFVSYARDDRYRAGYIVRELRTARLRVFWDQDLLPRQDFRAVIEREIRQADCTLVLWSKSSVRSDFVTDEAQLATKIGNYAPVLLERVKPPMGLRSKQFLWLDQWAGDTASPAWQQLLNTAQGLHSADGSLVLPEEAFSSDPTSPLMIPFKISKLAGNAIRVSRIAVSADFVTAEQLRECPECAPSEVEWPRHLAHPYAEYATPSFEGATIYCEWLSRRSKLRYRLLTSREYDVIASARNPALSRGAVEDPNVSPKEFFDALMHFTGALWTWISDAWTIPVKDQMISVAEVKGGCWLTPVTNSRIPSAVLTTGARLPFVGLRLVADT